MSGHEPCDPDPGTCRREFKSTSSKPYPHLCGRPVHRDGMCWKCAKELRFYTSKGEEVVSGKAGQSDS